MRARELKLVLQKLSAESAYRTRLLLSSAQDVKVMINGRQLVNFSSNDYLGLANHPKLKEAVRQGVKKYGVGSGASHLICGHQTPHYDLEQAMADFFQVERALVFSSGFMANLGIVSALCERDGVILQDKLNHASLIDAGKSSDAQLFRYHHLDNARLERLLTKHQDADKLIASDALFSMDGDCADVKSLVQLADKYDSWLLLDEAHSFGVIGQQGRGAADYYDQTGKVSIIMATMGKALGTYGAVVLGSSELIEWLLQKARTYIYTTAMPPALAYASIHALALLKHSDELRAHLGSLVQRLHDNLHGVYAFKNQTPIQTILVKQNNKALKLSQYLWDNGLLVKAIRPPTVPFNTARLRITLCANHNLSDIDFLSEYLIKGLKL